MPCSSSTRRAPRCSVRPRPQQRRCPGASGGTPSRLQESVPEQQKQAYSPAGRAHHTAIPQRSTRLGHLVRHAVYSSRNVRWPSGSRVDHGARQRERPIAPLSSTQYSRGTSKSSGSAKHGDPESMSMTDPPSASGLRPLDEEQPLSEIEKPPATTIAVTIIALVLLDRARIEYLSLPLDCSPMLR